jgi:hypothetical protein
MNLPKPLNCSEAGMGDILRALISRKLDSSTEDQLLLHLRQCPACLSALAEVLRETPRAEWADDNPPEINQHRA